MYTGEGKGGPDPSEGVVVFQTPPPSLLILDGTGSHRRRITERSERSERSGVYLSQPSLLYCMLKEERKLLKLQSKAQECVSRKKAQKILKKEKKWQKCLRA